MSIRTILASLVAITFLLSGCGSSGPSGTYEAADPNGSGATMTLEFKDDKNVKVGIGGGREMEGMDFGFDTTYTFDGDTVTIASPMGDDDPLVLTMKGGTIEGDVEGDHLVFKKK